MAPSKRSAATSTQPSKSAKAVFGGVGKKLAAHKTLNRGLLAFRLTGSGAGNYIVDCSKGGLVEAEYASQRLPTVEIIGDAKRIQAIFERKKDARKQFLAGGIRVRGDLRYLSDMLLELGILDEPL